MFSPYLHKHFMSTSNASKASLSVELTVIVLFFPPIPSSIEDCVGSYVHSPSTTNLYSWVPRGNSMIVTKQDEDVSDMGINCQLLNVPLKNTSFGLRNNGVWRQSHVDCHAAQAHGAGHVRTRQWLAPSFLPRTELPSDPRSPL